MTMQYPDPKAIGLDGVQLLDNLYQGSCPAPGRELGAAGFRVLVICAEELCELYPASSLSSAPAAFPGVHIVHCPLRDELSLPDRSWTDIARTAAIMGQMVKEPFLVACSQGKNRSALVAAAILRRMAGWSGRDCVDLIKQRAPRTFSNEYFLRTAESWPPPKSIQERVRQHFETRTAHASDILTTGWRRS